MKRKLAKYNIQLKVHYKVGLDWVCHDGLENSHLGLVLMKNGLGSCFDTEMVNLKLPKSLNWASTS